MDAGGRATQDAKAERTYPQRSVGPDAGCVSSWLLLLAAQQEEVTRREGEISKLSLSKCGGFSRKQGRPLGLGVKRLPVPPYAAESAAAKPRLAAGQ